MHTRIRQGMTRTTAAGKGQWAGGSAVQGALGGRVIHKCRLTVCSLSDAGLRAGASSGPLPCRPRQRLARPLAGTRGMHEQGALQALPHRAVGASWNLTRVGRVPRRMGPLEAATSMRTCRGPAAVGQEGVFAGDKERNMGGRGVDSAGGEGVGSGSERGPGLTGGLCHLSAWQALVRCPMHAASPLLPRSRGPPPAAAAPAA